MADRTIIRQFYEALYGDEGINEERRLVLWTPGKSSNVWCSSLEDAVENTAKRSAKNDAYFLACLQSPQAMVAEAERRGDKPNMGSRRGYEQSAALMPALWLDLDFGTKGHEKKKLPPTVKHAQYIIDGMPAPPSMVVHTGGGLHAWWVFLDPLELDTADARKRARALSFGWASLAKKICDDRGWDMDSVYDLARVMRPAGTSNRKKVYDEAPPVELLFFDEAVRHDVDGLEVFLPTGAEPPQAASEISVDGYKFSLDPAAEPPVDRLMKLCEMDVAFRRTWERQRDGDLPSQSEYDLALATRMADVGFSDQEIVNTMIAHRRKHGQPEKLRHDYYATRLAMVRQQAPDIADGLERLTEVGTEIAAGIKIKSERRGEIKDNLSKLMALPKGSEVSRVEKYDGDPPTYALLTCSGRITLGGVAMITNANSFRNAIADATGHLIRRFKGPTWDKIAQAILHAAEPVDLGDEVSMDGEVLSWLTAYLEDEPPDVGLTEGCEAKVPFTHGGKVYVVLMSFRSFLRMSLDIRIDARTLARRLKQTGAVNRGVSYRLSGKSGRVSSRSCYCIPKSVVSGARGVVPDEVEAEDEV